MPPADPIAGARPFSAPLIAALALCLFAITGCSTKSLAIENASPHIIRVSACTDGRGGLPRNYPPTIKTFDAIPGSITARTLEEFPFTGSGRIIAQVYWASGTGSRAHLWQHTEVVLYGPGPYALRFTGDDRAMAMHRIDAAGAEMPSTTWSTRWIDEVIAEELPKVSLKP